jgi:hypothetical protein
LQAFNSGWFCSIILALEFPNTYESVNSMFRLMLRLSYALHFD